MTTSGVDADTQAVQNATNQMQDAISNLRQSVNAVDSASDAARNGFVGQAGDTFRTTSQAWSDEAEKLNKTLDDLAAATNEAKNAVLNLDEEQSGEVGSVATGGHTNL